MKRYKSGILSAILPTVMLVLTLALSSCVKESLPDGGEFGEGKATVTLELVPPGAFSEVQTRAMTDVQQTAIYRAEVLVFKDNILLYHMAGTVTNIDGVKKRVQVNLKTSQNESELFDVMVIGNPPSDFKFDPYLTKTKDALKAAFNRSSKGKWTGSEFIMYGEALQTLIKPTTNNLMIQMIRSLARIDIGVGAYDEATDTWAGLGTTFSLTEVRVVNSRDKFAAIPSATTFNSTGNIKVGAPTIPSDAGVQGTTAETAIKYSDITFVEGQGRHIKSSIFIAEAPNTTNRVTLLIGGSYNGGSTTYYRIDMCVPRAGTPGSYDYLDILRNHLYRINITSVSGAGFFDIQQALYADPINITTELVPIEEESMGDIVFDGNNYIMSDVSQVQLYINPDEVKTYTIATVKANFPPGVTATVKGPGISTLYLESNVARTISATIPTRIKTGSYTIKVGRLTKIISLTVQPPIDAHFDLLPFQNVASIAIEAPQPWITLSNNMTYVKNEQQLANITGDANGKACFHFDENIATTGDPRTAKALVFRNNSQGVTRVYFEQCNLKGMVVGYFGGEMNNEGFTQRLAIESVEEATKRDYDDSSIIETKTGIKWGFNEKSIGTPMELGRESTIALAKRDDSGVTPPYSIYNGYAARYCYEKNRSNSADGTLSDSDIKWYLPAQNQVLSAWVGHSGLEMPFSENIYQSITEYHSTYALNVLFSSCTTITSTKLSKPSIRCVRDLSNNE